MGSLKTEKFIAASSLCTALQANLSLLEQSSDCTGVNTAVTVARIKVIWPLEPCRFGKNHPSYFSKQSQLPLHVQQQQNNKTKNEDKTKIQSKRL